MGKYRNGRILGGLLIALGAGLFGSAACGTATFVVQQYKGEPLPSHVVAVLRFSGGDEALVVTLDGEVLKTGGFDKGERVHVELLPGEHEVGIANGASEVVIVQRVKFRAEQGKFYRARIVATAPSAGLPELGGGIPWSSFIYEIDRDNDAWLKDVSLPPPVEPVEPAPAPAPPPATEPAPSTEPVPSAVPGNLGSGGAASVTAQGQAGAPAAGAASVLPAGTAGAPPATK